VITVIIGMIMLPDGLNPHSVLVSAIGHAVQHL
jgi:hypothetical protein